MLSVIGFSIYRTPQLFIINYSLLIVKPIFVALKYNNGTQT